MQPESCYVLPRPGCLVISPYVSRLPTEATGTPSHCSTLGRRPRPKFTPVSTFSPPGSISLIVRPSQPSLPIVSGTAVCQTSVERKCERYRRLGYPTPCMMATVVLVPQALDRLHAGAEPQRPVYRQHLIFGDIDVRTSVVVSTVGEGDYGVDVVRFPPLSWTTDERAARLRLRSRSLLLRSLVNLDPVTVTVHDGTSLPSLTRALRRWDPRNTSPRTTTLRSYRPGSLAVGWTDAALARASGSSTLASKNSLAHTDKRRLAARAH